MKILLIAYHYPPENNGGTVRPEKFAKFLAMLGHQVTVLTYKHDFGANMICDRNIIRIYDVSRKGINFLWWAPIRVLQKLTRRMGIYSSCHSIWIALTKVCSQKIFDKIKPDIIISTYPPIATLDLGLYFAQKYSIPLVADFRDGLLFDPIEYENLNNNNMRNYYANIEKKIAHYSTGIITVSEPISEYFRKEYNKTKVITIPNGYDPDDYTFSEIDKSIFSSDIINIVFTGQLSLSDKRLGETFKSFFVAFHELLLTDNTLINKIRVHMYGKYTENEIEVMRPLINSGVVVINTTVPRATSICYQHAADILLQFVSPNRVSGVSTKLFEYLMAERPVLMLTRGTEAGRIVTDTNAGWVIDPFDKNKIKAWLQEVIKNPEIYKSYRVNHAKIKQYSRKSEVKMLSTWLESLVKG